MLHGGIVGAQDVHLLLRVVADNHISARLHPPCLRREQSREGLDQRGLALPVRTQHANACTSRNVAINTPQHRRKPWVTTVGRAQPQQLLRLSCRLQKFETQRIRQHHRCQPLHAFQCLEPALRLLRLGGLGTEALDETGEVGNVLLLLCVGMLLLLQRQRPALLEFGIAARVAGEPALVDMHRDARNGIEKFAVVRNDQQGPGVTRQPVLQPHQRIEIEVVGRFVQQHAVAGLKQSLREGQAHAPAPGEASHRLTKLRRREPEAEQQRLGTCLRRVGVGQLELLAGSGHGHAIVPGCCKRGTRALQRRVGLADEFHRGKRGIRRILRH